MKFTSEFLWINSFLSHDSFWFEDVLNWDESFSLTLSEYDLLSFLFSAFFVNTHIFIDTHNKSSFLDLLLTLEFVSDLFVFELYNAFCIDNLLILETLFFYGHFLFFTDYQDLYIVFLYHAPELVLVFTEYVQLYWKVGIFSQSPTAVFDFFTDSNSTSVNEFLENLTGTFFFFWALLLFTGNLRLKKWFTSTDAYWTRLESYFFSFSRTTRAQYEAVLKIVFMLLFYFSMMIATFDDDQEEILELLNTSCFYLLLFFFFYFVYKYSIHFLSFLEATISEGKSLVFALKQSGRDLINSGSLLLRVVVLVIRLNIYDGVDDVLDSYYIFVADFDDEEYFNDLFFSISPLLFFDADTHDDRSIFLEDEFDINLDLFSLYFIVWSKFALFIAFILEELGRVALALFITYLILFEVQAVNRSYVEDTYFLDKMTRFKLTN